MKKILLLAVAALGLFMTSCRSTSVLNASYPLVNAPVVAELQPQLQIGGAVTKTVHFSKLGPIIFKTDFDVKKTVNADAVGARGGLAALKNPIARLRGAILYATLEGTNYDLILAPVYTIERDGIKFTVTVKGYGAKLTGVKQ